MVISVARFVFCSFLFSSLLVPTNTAYSLGDSTALEQQTELERLLSEAQELFSQGRSIDARAILQKALQESPLDYRPSMELGWYYLVDVGHFRLAHRYIKNALSLFETKHGNEDVALAEKSEDPKWNTHARLLLLLSETQLNLDDYRSSLQTLERFEKSYWDPGLSSSKAWVLMKLKRIDEAVKVAQQGLMQGAAPGRTLNVLGILVSLNRSPDAALSAFYQAIQIYAAMGQRSYISTPLNNAGEVYREMFQDEMSEAMLLKAISLPGGCEHILSSVNTTLLYIDQLRLLGAQRILTDFQACFSQNGVRSDTEHRGLLSMFSGRIAFRMGEIDNSLQFLDSALNSSQWFGKIGTDPNDYLFAALSTHALALKGKAAVLSDKKTVGIASRLALSYQIAKTRFLSYWEMKRARSFALTELSDFEDLYIRHTDSMIQYPSLHYLLSGYAPSALEKRLSRLIEDDIRDNADKHYFLYLAANALAFGKKEKAIEILENLLPRWREIDRLARAETIVLLLRAYKEEKSLWAGKERAKVLKEEKLLEELYRLHPPLVRYSGFSLPAVLSISSRDKRSEKVLKKIAKHLAKHRISSPENENPKYKLLLSGISTKDTVSVTMELRNLESDRILLSLRGDIDNTEQEIADYINKTTDALFVHKQDPTPPELPRLTELEAVM